MTAIVMFIYLRRLSIVDAIPHGAEPASMPTRLGITSSLLQELE